VRTVFLARRYSISEPGGYSIYAKRNGDEKSTTINLSGGNQSFLLIANRRELCNIVAMFNEILQDYDEPENVRRDA
jgi:hypothetical protein